MGNSIIPIIANYYVNTTVVLAGVGGVFSPGVPRPHPPRHPPGQHQGLRLPTTGIHNYYQHWFANYIRKALTVHCISVFSFHVYKLCFSSMIKPQKQHLSFCFLRKPSLK